jgi:protein-tyrosine phosphatase
MAEVLLADGLRRRGETVQVRSAGFRRGGQPAAAHARTVVAERGLDLEHHVSRPVTAPMLAAADLVLTMERAHVASAVLQEPACWPVCFSLDEALARAGEAGPRLPGQSWADWIATWHPGRRPSDVMDRLSGDLPDPMGGSLRRFRATADSLEASVDALLDLALPGTAPAPTALPEQDGSSRARGLPLPWRRRARTVG